MRVFGFIGLLALAGCCSTEPRLKTVPWSQISDTRNLPIQFSLEEIITRTWTEPGGEAIGVLSHQFFQTSGPKPIEVLVVVFGVANSKRAVCIDFHSTQETHEGKAYLLLCHDRSCPAYDTTITHEAQAGRNFFTVRGEDSIPETFERSGRQYSFELNPKLQMVLGPSEFVFRPSR